MKYIALFLPVAIFAGLEGKQTYHSNNLDKKVEFPQRHHENPLHTTTHKKNSLKKVTSETKTKMHNILNQPNEYKKTELERKHIELQKKTDRKKILKETKGEIKELKKGIKAKSKKTIKDNKKKKEELRKKKGYRR